MFYLGKLQKAGLLQMAGDHYDTRRIAIPGAVFLIPYDRLEIADNYDHVTIGRKNFMMETAKEVTQNG